MRLQDYLGIAFAVGCGAILGITAGAAIICELIYWRTGPR